MSQKENKKAKQSGSRHTMVDIARLAGVDVSTVSRALADSSRVVPETKAKIREIVNSIGYVTNFHASRLRTNRAGQVLVTVPNLAAAFFPEVIRGIEDTMTNHGIGVLVGSTHRDPEREEAFAKQLMSGAVDGLIILTGHMPQILEELPDYDRRVIAVSRPTPNSKIPTITIDNADATETAMKHLLSLGHKRITHLAGPGFSLAFQTRAETYLSIMRGEGYSNFSQLEELKQWDIAGGVKAMTKVLSSDERPTAILAASDELAIGAIRAIRVAGLRVPQDISVMGYDDLPICEAYEPPITTIQLSRRDMGRWGADMLLENLDHSKPKPKDRTVDYKLIVRESTGPVPKT
jgi:DNA-binding LacI/PurR family transcriptional regulator